MSQEPNGRAAALDATGITKRFGPTTALDDVRLRVEPGEAHALVGRNGAGKSTLVSIITGLAEADAGTVTFDGRPAPPVSDREAWRSVVACVYQKSTIIPSLSVAENLFLGRQQRRGGRIDWKTMRAEAQEMLDRWDIAVDVARDADVLTVEQRQMVEIARALSFGAQFIILDEPTAQLDGKGIDRLYGRLRGIQERGIAYLFISHHLQEIFDLCDTVTVFRDAKHITTAPVASMTSDELVSAMTGDADLAAAGDHVSTVRPGRPVLTVDRLSRTDEFTEVSFEVAPGEVVGITGSGSSGRIALAETIVGLRSPTGGAVDVAGTRPKPGSVPAALRAGIGFVPRDRHHQGLVESLGVGENITMTVPRRLGRFGYLSPRKRDALAREAMGSLSVVASGPEQLTGSLSGGNQQKVVMGRALASDPEVLVLMHPTAGVDVRSKAALIEVVDQVRDQGTGVVIVSDELDDLRPCDRVLVMVHGRVATEFPHGWKDGDIVAATEGVEQ